MMTNNNIGKWNTGNKNTGNRNTGNKNTGNRNLGDHNTGDHNTGKWNTGDWNIGYWNTGYYNTGDYNTGDWNIGKWNTGTHNTGDHNTGNHNTTSFHVGHFNTEVAKKVYCFNSLIDIDTWDEAYKPSWLYDPEHIEWVPVDDMTPQEKEDNPSYTIAKGYFRTNDMKEQWRKAYAGASEEDIQAVRDLPAFDYKVFEEITGLDLRVKAVRSKRTGMNDD